jgi:hypothetical protein
LASAAEGARVVVAHLSEFHLRVPGLEATPHRGFDPALRFGGAHALAEEIGITTEVVCRRESDRVDAVLDSDLAGGWESGDPLGERCNEIAECVRWQSSIDPAVPFGELCVVILGT